jgi:hypothetical protein
LTGLFAHTVGAIEYFTWLNAKLDSIEAVPSSRVKRTMADLPGRGESVQFCARRSPRRAKMGAKSRAPKSQFRERIQAENVEVPLTSGAEADGKIVWSCHPDAGVKSAIRSAGDGGKRARSPGSTL